MDTFLARTMQGPQICKVPTKGRIEGLEVLDQYWLQSPHPKVIMIFSAESNCPNLELSSEWEQDFDVTVVVPRRV